MSDFKPVTSADLVARTARAEPGIVRFLLDPEWRSEHSPAVFFGELP